MKTDTMILLALAAVAIYFVTKEQATAYPPTPNMFPPSSDAAEGA